MLLRIMILCGLLAMLPATANAERRVALVIGNSTYTNATSLRNPRNDAGDMAETLRKIGFEVELGLDLDQRGFAQTLETFARTLDGADAGLFFYAGHAVQMNDKNYLVSVNAKLDSEFLLSSEAIELDAIVRLMESKTAVNILFLDACRNNPLTENLRRNMKAMKRSAALGRGLARIEPSGRDTLIAFAAAPGQEANDGAERNSPFTAALLQHMPKPGLEVSVMLKEVAADVRRDTRNSQRPQQLSDMARPFYFVKTAAAATLRVEPTVTPQLIAKPAPAPQTAVAAATPAPAPASVPVAAPAPVATPTPPPFEDRTLDVAFWNSAQSTSDCESIRAYQARFPNGIFIELARLSERRLCNDRKVTVLESARPDLSRPAATPAPAFTQAAAAPPPPAALPAPAPAQSIVVAAVPSSSATAPAPVKPAGPTPAELTRVIQLELYRLGCGASGADGKWSPPTKEGLRRFNLATRSKLNLDAPADATVAALQGKDGRICPLVCGRGLQVRGDTCVAVVREQQKKHLRRAERSERSVRRYRAPVEQAAPAQAQAAPPPAAGPAFMMGGPGFGAGMLFFGMGRRRF